MSTGNFADWQGAMTDLGPLYPFVGSEKLWVLIGAVAYIGWVILQWRMETRMMEKDLQLLQQSGNLERAIKGEKLVRPT